MRRLIKFVFILVGIFVAGFSAWYWGGELYEKRIKTRP